MFHIWLIVRLILEQKIIFCLFVKYETAGRASCGLGEFDDAAVVVFGNQFTNAIENGDATKLATGSKGLAFLNNNIALSIDARPEVIVTDELLVQL
jgi:hypothetical protein